MWRRGRERQGIPEWERVKHWLNPDSSAVYRKEEKAVHAKLENPELATLDNYEVPPREEFWNNFPKRKLPERAETKLNVKNLEKEVGKNEPKMSRTELRRARKLIRDLRKGADAYQKMPALPPMTASNAKSAYENGQMLTDKIASWIKKGFVAGPFNCPPVPGFRANPLATVCRSGKIRPILNMSGPRGRSFNDNIDERKLEKVHMSTARLFSYAVKEAGVGAVFSKFDICDAYKLIPAKPDDFRLQGFIWLGKFFCETQESFGSKASVCNFDRLGNTKDLLACLNSEVPRDKIFRVLDDTPCVFSADSNRTQTFSKEMRRLCNSLNLPLAKNCEKREKAFENVTEGTVLGVKFNSVNMTWSLPEDRADKVIRRCLDAANSKHMELLQTQELMGSVNDLAQMCPAIKFHKGSGNRFLESFKGNNNIVKQTTPGFREDMNIAAKVAEEARKGLPIASRPVNPPLSALMFYTDAAGASFSMCNGKMVFHEQEGRGVACIGGEDMESIWIACKLNWPEGLISGLRDEKGVPFGCKSTFLESVGLLLPFLVCPEKIRGRHMVFRVDNMAVVHGWSRGYVKYDKSASEVIKCVGYLSFYYGTTVHVEHVPRMSNEMADLADELSRKSVLKKEEIQEILKEVMVEETSSSLRGWLSDPTSQEHLTNILLRKV